MDQIIFTVILLLNVFHQTILTSTNRSLPRNDDSYVNDGFETTAANYEVKTNSTRHTIDYRNLAEVTIENELQTSPSVRDITQNENTLALIKGWSIAIKKYIRGMNCNSMQFTTLGRCETVKVTPFKFMKFYVAPPRRNTMYTVVLPTDELVNPTSHYSIVVVDPFPSAGYGHLVYIFYIDGGTFPWCVKNGGKFLDSGLCLHHSKLSKCPMNLRRRAFQSAWTGRCEVSFIPLVFDQLGDETGSVQMLRCFSGFSGFGNCWSKSDHVPSTVVENCEVLYNTRDCYTRGSSNKSRRRRLCAHYQTCDNAVAVFGGWNNLTNGVKHHKNVKDMFTMLRRNGFRKDDIQIFYNGNGNIEVGENYVHGLPASAKREIRHHIDTLCSSPLCVDSFVIYFNGPTTNNGDLLLWDKNADGRADESEIYTVGEILDDVAACSANIVYIFADQSHAGLLANALIRRRSMEPSAYENIALFSSSDPSQYSWERESTLHWGRLTTLRSAAWSVNELGYTRSRSTIVNSQLAENYTIYGAPIIGGVPPHAGNMNLLRKKYMGCQLLPNPRWRLSFLHTQSNENEQSKK